MKKSLLGLLLAVAMVVPAFATDQGKFEVGAKLGYIMSPIVHINVDGEHESFDFNSTFSLEADAFYFVEKSLGLGFGVEYIFKSSLDIPVEGDFMDGFKAGNTNLFAQAKYEFDLKDDKIFNNIYVFGKLGYGIINISVDKYESIIKDMIDNGLFWALGVGTTIYNNFLFEVQYSCNYGKFNEPGYTIDLTYRTLQAKIGYKFMI